MKNKHNKNPLDSIGIFPDDRYGTLVRIVGIGKRCNTEYGEETRYDHSKPMGLVVGYRSHPHRSGEYVLQMVNGENIAPWKPIEYIKGKHLEIVS